jgi:hypothetical protein
MQNSNSSQALLTRISTFPQRFDERGDLVPGLPRDQKLAILYFRRGEIDVRRSLIYSNDQARDTGWDVQGARLALNGLERNPRELELLANVRGDLELALFE